MKKTMKTLKEIVLLIGLLTALWLVLSIIGVILFPIFFSDCFQIIGFFSFESPEIPVIKKGEFPFEIVYEKDGECISITDTYVCEYDGIDITMGGKFRSWSGYFKSNKEEELTIFKDDTTEIQISIGAARYYMNDPDFSNIIGENTPSFFRIIEEDDGGGYGESISDEEVYSEYGIRIISWELSDPIQNTFEPKKWYEFWK